jgi:peptidoglycan/LPS O-acetylase OafA/YrhL
MATKRILFVVLLALVMAATPMIAAVHAQTTITIPTLTISDTTFVLIIIDAVLGALVAAYMGWLDSGEPFDAKKFSSSILHGIIAAVIFVLGYSFATSVSPWDFLVIFLGSAGVDVVINRTTGAIAQKAPSTTDPAKPKTKVDTSKTGSEASAPSTPATQTKS